MLESNTHPMMRLLLPAAAAADFLLLKIIVLLQPLLLKEAGKLPQEEVQEMKSERRGRFLDMNKNYEQQSIYDGDILCIQ